jgi:hypothetical protein
LTGEWTSSCCSSLTGEWTSSLTDDDEIRWSVELVTVVKFAACSFLSVSSVELPAKSREISFLLCCGDDISLNCLNGSFGDGVIPVLFVWIGCKSGALGSRSSKRVFLSVISPLVFELKFNDESSDSSFLRVENS